MNLSEMRTIVRRDLHDEDVNNYRWTNDEIDRHIAHAVKDYSEAVPHEQKITKVTTAGSRDIDISTLNDLVVIEAVEYPVDKFPRSYQRFSFWSNVITVLSDEVPDGSNAYIYYGGLHILDVSISTITAWHEDLIAVGACGYAALEWAVYAVNRVNLGSSPVAGEFLKWGKEKLGLFQQESKRLGRKNRIRIGSLYLPYTPPVNQNTDYGL